MQILTAGKADEQVLDGGPYGHSVFTGNLIKTLESVEDFTTAQALSASIQRSVSREARDKGHAQTPMYDRVTGGGDFVLLTTKQQTELAVDNVGYEAVLAWEPGYVIVEAGQADGVRGNSALEVQVPGDVSLLAMPTEIRTERTLAKLQEETVWSRGAATVTFREATIDEIQPELALAFGPGVPESLQKALTEDSPIPMATDGQSALVTLSVEGDRLHLRDFQSATVSFVTDCHAGLVKTLPLDSPVLLQQVQDTLYLWSTRRHIAALTNDDTSSEVEISMEFRSVDVNLNDNSDEIIVTSDNGPILQGTTLETGSIFQPFVRNKGAREVYVAIIELRSDGGIQALFPYVGMNRDETLIKPGETMKVDPMIADPTPGQLSWKLIATTEHIDFSSLGDSMTCRSDLNTRGSASRGQELYSSFMDAVTVAPGSKPAEFSDDWGTSTFTVTIAKE